MRRPIVTTDLDFARDVCGEAALYFAPMDAGSAAEAILALTRGETERALVRAGTEHLSHCRTPAEAHEMVMDVIETTSRG